MDILDNLGGFGCNIGGRPSRSASDCGLRRFYHA
jgi:hypothetical protein